MSRSYGMQSPVRKVFEILAVVLSIIFLVSTILFFINMWEKKHDEYGVLNSGSLDKTIEYNGEKYVLKEEIETFLVLGLDKYEQENIESYNNDKRADFLMLFVVDNKNSTFNVLHIDRDTIAEMNILGVAGDKVGTVKKQIALAHTYGNGKEMSCRNVTDAVSKLLLNANVDHYLSVTMDAVPLYNDLVGGVEVTVLDDFSGIDASLVKGEKVTLMGEQSLNYIRTRLGLDDSSNKTRMKRQRQYLNALYSKTQQAVEKDKGFIENSFMQLSTYMVADCSVNRLEQLAEKLTSYEFVEYYDLKGEYVVGEQFMEFYPDEDSVIDIAVKLFYTPKD